MLVSEKKNVIQWGGVLTKACWGGGLEKNPQITKSRISWL